VYAGHRQRNAFSSAVESDIQRFRQIFDGYDGTAICCCEGRLIAPENAQRGDKVNAITEPVLCSAVEKLNSAQNSG
jgi:hypothetical protein